MRPCRHCFGRHMDKGCPKAPPAPGGWSAAPKSKAATPPTSTTKGKGKNKSAGGQFNGICNRCGRWGHRLATCKVVMALEGSAESVNCMREIMSVEKVNGDAGVLLM
eukprot:3116821-Heterocapsa_arctica.AAC.1